MSSPALEAFVAYHNAFFPDFKVESKIEIDMWQKFADRVPVSAMEDLCRRVAIDKGDRFRPKLYIFESIWKKIRAYREQQRKVDEVDEWIKSLSPVDNWMARVRYNSLNELQKITKRQEENLCAVIGTTMAYHPDPDHDQSGGRVIDSSYLVCGYVCLAREMNRSWHAVEQELQEGEEPGARQETDWFYRVHKLGLLNDEAFRDALEGKREEINYEEFVGDPEEDRAMVARMDAEQPEPEEEPLFASREETEDGLIPF